MANEQNPIKLPPVDPKLLGTKDVKTMSQSEIDAETSRIRLEAEKLKLQRELLELEKLTYDIEQSRGKRSLREMTATSNTNAINDAIKGRQLHEEQCTHMKGGASEDLLNGQISRGNDSSNYAFITHTLSTGVKFRMCQRCFRTWFPKDPDYKWAMSRPSKNTASDSCRVDGLMTDRSQIRLESEIKHSNVAPPDQSYSQGPAGY